MKDFNQHQNEDWSSEVRDRHFREMLREFYELEEKNSLKLELAEQLNIYRPEKNKHNKRRFFYRAYSAVAASFLLIFLTMGFLFHRQYHKVFTDKKNAISTGNDKPFFHNNILTKTTENLHLFLQKNQQHAHNHNTTSTSQIHPGKTSEVNYYADPPVRNHIVIKTKKAALKKQSNLLGLYNKKTIAQITPPMTEVSRNTDNENSGTSADWFSVQILKKINGFCKKVFPDISPYAKLDFKTFSPIKPNPKLNLLLLNPVEVVSTKSRYSSGSNNNITNIGMHAYNIGNTSIKGLDISFSGSGELFGLKTSMLAGYTFIDPKYKQFDESGFELPPTSTFGTPEQIPAANSVADYNILKYRHKHSFKFDLNATYKNCTLGISGYHYSHMVNIDKMFNIIIKGLEAYRAENNSGFHFFDARLGYEFKNKTSINLICKNIFNNEYTLRPALLEAPRNLTLRVDHRF